MARRLGAALGASRAGIQRLIAAGDVVVGGTIARRPAQRVAFGHVVSVSAPPERRRLRPIGEASDLVVVYEDDVLLVVNKRAGVVVHPSFHHASGTLVNALVGHAEREGGQWQPRLVQRLDKGTSGLLLVTKSADALIALQRRPDHLTKEYLALVWGRPPARSGTMTERLGRSPLDPRLVMARRDGAEACTRYRVAARGRGLSVVQCELVTGRTHQIRVHLAANGCPIVGDPVYGRPPTARLADTRLDRAARALGRQALHAWRLTVRHPSTGRVMSFTAPLPSDLAGLVELITRGQPLDGPSGLSSGRTTRQNEP